MANPSIISDDQGDVDGIAWVIDFYLSRLMEHLGVISHMKMERKW